MTSEIRVNKIENRSGLGTVTFADTGVDLAGIVTATTFSGSGASLTDLPAASLTGTVADARFPATLPATSAANLTNVPAANVVGVHTSLTVTNATTTGTAVVGGGVTISESGIEASGIGITCADINGTQIGGRRNVVINGGMQIYQRGSQSYAHDGTTSGYALDRFNYQISNTDEYDSTVTQDTSVPDGQGFSKSLKVTTGTAESAVDANERFEIQTRLEGQDLQHFSYGSSAAKTITLSFWVKCSIAGTYGFTIYRDESAGARVINRPYTINSANTWEKKIITIAGDTVRSIDNNSGTTNSTWRMVWPMSGGSNWTSGTHSTWGAYSQSYYLGGHVTNTFATTAGSTWYLTGVQLEVGSEATPFEHRSYGEELILCQRYYQQYVNISAVGYVPDNSSRSYSHAVPLPVAMRAGPTMSITNTGSSNGQMITDGDTNRYISSLLSQGSKTTHMSASFNLTGDLANFRGAYLISTTSSSSQTTYKLSAEL